VKTGPAGVPPHARGSTGSYTLADHRRYLDGWFDTVGVTDRVTLVLHDWGSALGFDRARRHPAAIQAIAYMEATVRPIGWQDLPPGFPDLLRALRSPAGEEMILQDNLSSKGSFRLACCALCHRKSWTNTGGRSPSPAKAAGRTQPFPGARYRRLTRRMPKKKALVATGNSMLVLIHALLSDPADSYHDLGADYYEQRMHARPQARNHVRASNASATRSPSKPSAPTPASPSPRPADPRT
jgi:pimeloyl-ACP methyl ester carboxylesterase